MDDDSSPGWLRPPDTRARRGPRDPLLTPPDSPRKRVRRLRDSEETDGSMTIETYIYRTSPYRSSTIPNPPPYPIEIVEISDEDFRTHYAQIEEILHQHGFPNIHDLIRRTHHYSHKGRFQVVKMSKPNYPGGETPKKVFLITFRDCDLPNQLGPARDEIREFLAMQGLRVDVEITNVGFFRQLILPISASDRAAHVYKEAENGLIDCLNRNLLSHWQGMTLFNIGFVKDKVTPTIVVYVPPRMDRDWANLRLQMLRLTISHPGIDVAFHPGEVTGALAQPGSPGHSIGTKGSGSSGTLGGYFDLEIHGKTQKGFLANYHVIYPWNAPEDVQKRANALGSSPARDDESRCVVMSPSEEDVTTEIDKINASLDTLKARKAELVKKDNEYKSMGIVKHSLSSRIIEVTQSIQTQEEKIQEVKNSLPCTIGKVLLSSGTAWFEGRVSDWAFVELVPGREPIPNTMPPYSELQERDFERAPAVKAGAPATGFGKIELGQIYLKYGRTTGVTVGVCNGVHLFIPKHARHVRGIPLTPLLPTDSPFPGSREFLITPTSGLTDFCRPGDSGSLVYDLRGKICGLLFGELDEPLVANPAVVTTFPSVLKAIEEKGGILSDPNLPQYESEDFSD